MNERFPNTLRINSNSSKVATFTKNYLERKLRYKFDYAISSRNIIMLDFDCRGEFDECFKEAKALGEALVNRYGSEACIYRTPNGYHLIYFKFIRWNVIKRLIRLLIAAIEGNDLLYLDKNHLEACLRRGYMTLRLQKQRKVWCYRYGVEQRF